MEPTSSPVVLPQNSPPKESFKGSFWRQLKEIFLILLIAVFVRTFLIGLYQVPTGSMETTMLIGERFFADKLSYFFRAPTHSEIVALMQPNYEFSQDPFWQFVERNLFGPQNWTKRVIACPGDHIRGVIENGMPVVYLNGSKLDEPYLNQYPLIAIQNSCAGGYTRRSYDPSAGFHAQPFYQIEEDTIYVDTSGKPYLTYPNQAKPLSIPASLRDERYWGECADEFDVKLESDEYWVMGDNRRGSQDSRYFGPIKQDTIFAHITWLLFSIDSNESWIVLDFIKNPVQFIKKIRLNRTLKRLV